MSVRLGGFVWAVAMVGRGRGYRYGRRPALPLGKPRRGDGKRACELDPAQIIAAQDVGRMARTRSARDEPSRDRFL